MTKVKKTNKVAMENIFVVSGNQVVPSGDFVGTSTNVNLDNGQLGVLAWDPDSTVRPQGEFKRAGDDSNEVQAIKLVVGTPKSNALHTVSVWEDGDLGFQESGVINKTNIWSVSVKNPEYPTAGAQLFEINSTFVADTEYKAYLRLKSVLNDRYYGDNDEIVHAIIPAQSEAPSVDFVIDSLVSQFDAQSKALFLTGNGSSKKGNRNFVMFAVDLGGGGGTVIGDITVGTSIPFASKSGVTSSYVADPALVQALAQFIVNGDSVFSATSTIEVVDFDSLGGSSADGILVVGLSHPVAVAFDNVEQRYVMPELQLGGGFTDQAVANDIYKAQDVNAKEGTGQGSKWLINWRDRAGLAVHTAQNQPKGDYFIEGKNYIDETAFYKSYTIEYFGTEDTLTTHETSPFKTTLLFPATANLTETVTDIDDNAKFDFTLTDASVTVGYVNNILDAWLEHARTTGNPFRLLGDIAGGGVYL